jgi:hypothetical protein
LRAPVEVGAALGRQPAGGSGIALWLLAGGSGLELGVSCVPGLGQSAGGSRTELGPLAVGSAMGLELGMSARGAALGRALGVTAGLENDTAPRMALELLAREHGTALGLLAGLLEGSRDHGTALELVMGLTAGPLGRSLEAAASAGGVSVDTSGCRSASDGTLLGVSYGPLVGAQDWTGSTSGGTLLLVTSDGPSAGAQDWEWSTSAGALLRASAAPSVGEQERTGSASDGTPMGTSDRGASSDAPGGTGVLDDTLGSTAIGAALCHWEGARDWIGSASDGTTLGTSEGWIGGTADGTPFGASTDCRLSSQGLRQAVIKHSPKDLL